MAFFHTLMFVVFQTRTLQYIVVVIEEIHRCIFLQQFLLIFIRPCLAVVQVHVDDSKAVHGFKQISSNICTNPVSIAEISASWTAGLDLEDLLSCAQLPKMIQRLVLGQT